MADRMQALTQDELHLIHNASMEVLTETGVKFHSADAVEIFRRNGFRTEGLRVLITEKDVENALETVPSRFTLTARNPEHSVSIGEDDFVFLPTSGPPNVVTSEGERRAATLEDYHTCCRLVQTSDQLQMTGFPMVQPGDIAPQTAHLDMMLANIVICDKPFLGAASSRMAAVDSLEMAAIAWGDKTNLRRQPVMGTIINPLSPLQYTVDEADSIIEMASLGQAMVITDMVMAGSSGPIFLPGVLVLANAEILGGVVLSQLAGPGSPVVYGSVSAPADMQTVIAAVGAPEAVVLASAIIQLARYYRLPCRTGGMLTNAHCADGQAAAEGTLMMSTAVRNGSNFILHACGQLGAYLSISFEKWLLDEEVCRMLRRVLTTADISVESIDVDTIKSVGSDGNYLLHPTTFRHCRELYRPELFTRDDYQKWYNNGARRVSDVAAEMLPRRLAGYTKPPIDEGLEQALSEYVQYRKSQLL